MLSLLQLRCRFANCVHSYLANLPPGKLWKRGYESGEITTPLFPDVVPTLSAWRAHFKRLAIFSSGSVEAQQNLFKYVEVDPSSTETDSGTKPPTQDLNSDFVGKFDTVTAGPKVVKESYEKICNALNTTPEKVVFLTDNVKGALAIQPPQLHRNLHASSQLAPHYSDNIFPALIPRPSYLCQSNNPFRSRSCDVCWRLRRCRRPAWQRTTQRG